MFCSILREWLSLDTVARRLELLKLEGLGFSKAEIVNELSQKMTCTKRLVYKDFETREMWQPTLQAVIEPNAVLMKVMNRYEQIYRQASLRFLSSSNELARMAALNIMLKANSLMAETAVPPTATKVIFFGKSSFSTLRKSKRALLSQGIVEFQLLPYTSFICRKLLCVCSF
jgi:hypothetical protein